MYNWQFMASNKYDDYKTVDQVYEQFIDYDNLA